METTRPADEADRTACRTLLAQALLEARARRGGLALVGSATPDDLLARWLDDAHDAHDADAGVRSHESTLYVGEFDGTPVGLGAVSTFRRPGTAALSGRVECCYVEDGARGVGVGSALMASMVQWCTEKGCGDVDAPALPGDRLSKQRFEAAGFTARLLILNRPLS